MLCNDGHVEGESPTVRSSPVRETTPVLVKYRDPPQASYPPSCSSSVGGCGALRANPGPFYHPYEFGLISGTSGAEVVCTHAAPVGEVILCRVRRSQSNGRWDVYTDVSSCGHYLISAFRSVNPMRASDFTFASGQSGVVFGHMERSGDFCSLFSGSKQARKAFPQPEIATVSFAYRPRCPVEMRVVVPALNSDGTAREMTHGSLRQQREKEPDDVFEMTNKLPAWNPSMKRYELDFRGRARIPSVKNMQLICPSLAKSETVMQFGKVSRNEFSLDFQYPLTLIQALAVALARASCINC